MLDINDVMRILPHRYPFLMVDRIVGFEGENKCTGVKCVTINEPFFQGHFPGHPVMPGVLIIEAMAQAAGMLVKLSAQHDADAPSIFYLVKVDKARFNRTVVPGDQLRLEIEHKRRMRNMSQFWGRALVDEMVVAEAEMLCAQVAAG